MSVPMSDEELCARLQAATGFHRWKPMYDFAPADTMDLLAWTLKQEWCWDVRISYGTRDVVATYCVDIMRTDTTSWSTGVGDTLEQAIARAVDWALKVREREK